MNSIAEELKQIIATGTKKYPLPQKMGNSIRVGNVVIRYSKNKQVYILFDCMKQEPLGTMNSKYSALAAAKEYADEKPLAPIQYLDTQYIKHMADIEVYENILNNSKDSFRKDLAEVRLGISEAKLDDVLTQLEDIIFK